MLFSKNYLVITALLLVTCQAVRENVAYVDQERLSEALALLQSLPYSNRMSYQYISSWHAGGGPNAPPPHHILYCPHGVDTFYPWHRAFLYEMEAAISAAGFPYLPYWDWFARDFTGNYIGIDPAFIRFPSLAGAFNPWTNSMTQRSVGSRAVLGLVEEQVRLAMGYTVFHRSGLPSFSATLENAHNVIHNWVGADMSRVRTASFDPIFYFHHTNVDRLWAEWQLRNPNAFVSAQFLNTPLQPSHWGAVGSMMQPPLYDTIVSGAGAFNKSVPHNATFVKLSNIPADKTINIAVKYTGSIIGIASVFGGDEEGEEETHHSYHPKTISRYLDVTRYDIKNKQQIEIQSIDLTTGSPTDEDLDYIEVNVIEAEV